MTDYSISDNRIAPEEADARARDHARQYPESIAANGSSVPHPLTVTINYGEHGQYHLQFRLDADGTVWGRYLPGDDSYCTTAGPWEQRESVPGTSDVVKAVRNLLTAWRLF